MPPLPILRLKQGATLALDLLLTDDLGSPLALGALSASVVVCDALGDAVATLPVTPSAEPGWGTIGSATAAWPLGGLRAEVWVTGNGAKAISETFSIAVERPVSL